jgi:succinate dehydrogenase hydrophobic anchor subunit
MRESTLWFWHMLAAGVILILLAIHMTIMHLDDILVMLGVSQGRPIDQDVVFARSRQLFFMVSYIILLAAALYHGLYGLRTILLELSQNKIFEKIINAVAILTGLALFCYGTWVAIAIYIMKEAKP